MHKVLKIAGYVMFAIAFGWVSAQLFFQEKTDQFLTSIFSHESQSVSEMEKLRVIYPEDALTLEPTSVHPATRQRLNNIYEPLVAFDRDLNFVPALALSWGLVDELTWEFHLRPEVKFHDGSDFDVDDVVASFDRAKNLPTSELKILTDSIEKIEVVDKQTFRIQTKNPDPILLSQLTNVFILPKEIAESKEDFSPVGTGPYRFRDWEAGELMVLDGFEKYWKGEPKFKRLELLTITEKSKRVNSFLAGEADFLAFVPFDAVNILQKNNFQITGIPSLEVQFLVFNHNSDIFSSSLSREIVSLAIDQNSIVGLVGGSAKPVSQFVSNGVFGFSPDIASHEFDIDKAKELDDSAVISGKTVQLHLPIGLDVLGNEVREKLKNIGVNVIVSYLETDKLLESFEQGKADLYFLGFRAGLGDSGEFLWDIVESGGAFNVGNYSNLEIDKMIVASSLEMDQKKRLQILQKIMMTLDEEFFGVPLFEYQTLYAFNEKVDFEPRIDGFLYFEDLTKK